MSEKAFTVVKRKVGRGQPCFIIAELSGNHKQDIKRAYKLIDAAADAGVDAVKLQTYTPDTLTIDSDKKWFRIGKSNTWAGQTLYDLYKTAYTPWEWHPKLFAYAKKRGLIIFSTPFDTTAVDFLEKLDPPLYKVASFESNDLELLRRIGKTKKPVLMSRGLASIKDVHLAIITLKKSGCPSIVILHCISSYPATLEQMNISTIPDIEKRFNVFAGLSDHSLGLTASVTAVTFGAKVVEKHLTLSRKEGGPDWAFSLEPDEFKQLVAEIRNVEKTIGKPSYVPDKREAENIVFRRSLFVVANVKRGEELTRKNIRCIRPGYGLSPKYLDQVLGKKASRDIERGTPLFRKFIT
ncbi:MAG: pseudaminic acid synthase [Patescibacteria group bacterium]